MSASLYFVHKAHSPLLTPVNEYLREFGIRKSKGTAPHSLHMHYNDGIEICYVLKGVFKWKVENHFHQVYPGQIFITNPWEWHGSPDDVLDRGIIAWLILKPQHFLPNGELRLGPWSRLTHEAQQKLGNLLVQRKSHILNNGPNIAEHYRSIFTELTKKPSCWQEKTNLTLDQVLISLIRLLHDQYDNPLPETGDSFAQDFEAKMSTSFHNKLNMDELAFSFGMSSSAFNKKVKKLTGFSPAEYQLALKINKAKELLRFSKEKIIDIAGQCGFCSSQHFASQFLKFTGTTPTDYRGSISSSYDKK